MPSLREYFSIKQLRRLIERNKRSKGYEFHLSTSQGPSEALDVIIHGRDNRPKQNDIPLFRLPAEILDMIIDWLPSANKIVLSQTCYDMALCDQVKVDLCAISKEERTSVFAELGTLLVDHYFCLVCGTLHSINENDLPWVPEPEWVREPCPQKETWGSRFSPVWGYAIALRHIPLAIKLNRVKMGNLQYLADIADAYYFQGRLDDAFRLWQTCEPLLTGREVQPVARMRYLLRYGAFLIHNYFLTNREEELMFSLVQQARQLAEALQDTSGIAFDC